MGNDTLPSPSPLDCSGSEKLDTAGSRGKLLFAAVSIDHAAAASPEQTAFQ
jgi:hypothetical protein